MSEYIWSLFFWVWVTSLNMMFSRPIHLPPNFKMSLFFFLLVVLHFVNVPHFPYPLFCWGAFRLFLGSGYGKQCCYEHSWTHVLVVWLSILIYSKAVLLGLVEGCFLIFWETTILKSKVTAPVYTPTSNWGVFALPHILSSISCL